MTKGTTDRERTIAWQDPALTVNGAEGRTGLEFMRAVRDGELPPPPIAVVMNMAPVEVEEGAVTFSAEPGEEFSNPIGVIHAGFAMTLLDSALGCAVHTTLPEGVGYTTLETKVNMVRPIRVGMGRVLARAEVLHSGRTTAVAEARLEAEETGKLLGMATTTCAVMPSTPRASMPGS